MHLMARNSLWMNSSIRWQLLLKTVILAYGTFTVQSKRRKMNSEKKSKPRSLCERINYVKTMADNLTIEKRRYIGCKAKLTDWIVETIQNVMPDANTFCDIFSGTAVVANRVIDKYQTVIINDFLYSNKIIYTAFFSNGECDRSKLETYINRYDSILPESLEPNYFSANYGGKYFDEISSRKIGFIRQDIEDNKDNLTEKEYCVLITSLIYNIDRIANTLGHYEAYIHKAIKPKTFRMRLIDYKQCDNVIIYREDSNSLARKIKADVVYIDPPYNSRQYSRFYHVYEVLVKWDKPVLYGVACKPPVENMSEYCSSRAAVAFADLIEHLDAKCIVVSYNNTYDSKSSSSRNKITLEEILGILNKKGQTEVLEHKHPYFNAGKTSFENHKELLFVTKTNGV